MSRILKQAHNTGQIRLWQTAGARPPNQGWDLAFDDHSQIIQQQLAGGRSADRAVIVVRDPRDVVVSSAYYHMVCEEAWVKRRSWSNPTSYQDKINSLPSMQERFQFEIDQCAGETIRSMCGVPWHDERILRSRYEDLVTDESLGAFREMFVFLGFSPDLVDSLCDLAYENSIFSGNIPVGGHRRNGLPGQHVLEFDSQTATYFADAFGSSLATLGY
ncbi:MAG: sulfotransferase domain-containing protein [Actinomycetia bacterium]|nr:sulfotransferase domain-containing protein [Actinomycetes bacterium]